MQVFKVGVFNVGHWAAYTTWFNPSWAGCCVHEIEATNGIEAKKAALIECRKHREKVRDERMNPDEFGGAAQRRRLRKERRTK